MAEADSLIDKEYLKEHYVEVYLEDAVAQLLMSRQDAKKPETSTPPIKIPNIKPCRFFKEYFAGLRHGNHVLFREFAFASATPYNRLSVMTSLLEAYRNHLFRENKHSAKDYHSMLQLVWPDFPMQVVLDAFEAYDGDDKKDENGIKFLDFVKALKASFCTGECDYETNILNTVLDDKLNELTEIFAQGGDVPKSLIEAEYLVNVRDPKKSQPFSLTHKVLDGSEFKRLLNFNDANSVSSDEPDIISGSSESKMSITKGKKKGKAKKSTAQSKSSAQCKGSNTSLCSSVSSKSTPPSKSTTDLGKSTAQKKGTLMNRSTSQTKTAAQKKGGTSLHRNNSAKSASESKSGSHSSKSDLGGKQLSASLNVITVSVKSEANEKAHRHRSRSKSVTPDQRNQSKKPWRSNSGSSESSLSP